MRKQATLIMCFALMLSGSRGLLDTTGETRDCDEGLHWEGGNCDAKMNVHYEVSITHNVDRT